MNKPVSCGTILAGIILLIMFLAGVGVIDMSPQNNTAATIVAAHTACEAQTDQHCD